ncbi:MAG: phosphonate ABC transporter substrate-binding protein [Betaproteobacteria bacterium]|nr:phosphonate ABC transporter substrate-binding protein [Betaproteobacteria bacterium]MBV9360691.1 phosphonate ABC transporter substrate-binding protein [Betaproteobacteria bacterium]
MLPKRFLATLVLAAAVMPAAAEMPKEINFGIIATDSSTALRGRWQPVLDDMGARVGVKVSAFFATDYAGVIEAMRFKKVDLAWFGNKSAIEAVDRANGEVFVQTLAEDGAGYYSLLITHRDSSFKTFDDVLKRGKEINFGIGDPNSTSGFVVPSYYVFALNHIDPKTHFKTIRAANHETNLQAVLNKQLDVATNNTEQMALLEKRLPEKAQEIRILWKSPLIASDPIVWRKDLDAETKSRLKAFFVAYGTSGPQAEQERQRLLGIQKWIGFRESSNAQLLPIRQIEVFREKSKVEADMQMAPAEKQAKLADLNRKLAELNSQLAQAKQ